MEFRRRVKLRCKSGSMLNAIQQEGRKLDIARHLEMLSLTYMKQGDYSEAEAACTRALSIREEGLGSENPYLTMPLSVLCQIKEDKGNCEDAVTYCKRAIVIKKAVRRRAPQCCEQLFL